MSKLPTWMPDLSDVDDAFGDNLPMSDHDIIRSIVTTAVEKALAEKAEAVDYHRNQADKMMNYGGDQAARIAELEGEVAKLRACVKVVDQIRGSVTDEFGGASDWCDYDAARAEVDKHEG